MPQLSQLRKQLLVHHIKPCSIWGHVLNRWVQIRRIRREWYGSSSPTCLQNTHALQNWEMNKQIRVREEGTSTYTHTHTQAARRAWDFFRGSIDRTGCFRSGTREPNTRVNIIWVGKRDFLIWQGGNLECEGNAENANLGLEGIAVLGIQRKANQYWFNETLIL